MRINRDSSPFLFPSSFPTNCPSESAPLSSSSPPPSAASSTSSHNSPYKPQRPPVSHPSTYYAQPAAFGPCPACEFHNQRCSEKCYIASFFPPNEVHKFAVVDSVFGSGNVVNFLQENNNSSYKPFLLLLRDTSREDDRENQSVTKINTQSQTNIPKELGKSMNSDPVRELIQGRELANQLKPHLKSTSADTIREHLVQRILSSFERSLSVLNSSESNKQLQDSVAPIISATNNHTKSTISMEGAPGSMGFDVYHSDAVKKRKTLPQTMARVIDSSENGLEERFDDGYSWIENGQKDVLGAKYPRIKHKCICGSTQKCGATNQTQRSDEDPTRYKVEYRGVHTCLNGQQCAPPPV